jgi:hypothetical protein
VSQPTISAHLKVLREAGLVATQRRGTTICYTLTRDPLARLADRLSGMGATAPAPPATAPPVTVPPTAAPPVTAPPTPAPPATAPASVA